MSDISDHTTPPAGSNCDGWYDATPPEGWHVERAHLIAEIVECHDREASLLEDLARITAERDTLLVALEPREVSQ